MENVHEYRKRPWGQGLALWEAAQVRLSVLSYNWLF